MSVTAVSLVFNGNDVGNIAPATRDRILAAAAELGYAPDGVAQSLRRRRTHSIGLVTDSIATSPFAGRLLAGAMDAASTRGYALLTYDSRNHRSLEQEAVVEFGRRKVDGIVFATMGLQEMSVLPDTSLAMVLANCTGPESDHFSVIPDESAAARGAAQLLLGLGHRRVVMLSGPDLPAPLGNVAGPMRATAFRAELESAGAWGSASVLELTGWTIDAGYAGAMRVLAEEDGEPRPAPDRPTAVFAVNDRVATGVLLAAAWLGLHVPQDVSVVGVDDQEELAANVVPALTTFALPHRAMGARAVEVLIDALTAGSAPPVGVERLPFELITRASAGPAPSA